MATFTPRSGIAVKILFIIPSITNYFTFLEDIAKLLDDHGNEVHLASSDTHISANDCYDRPVVGTLHEIDFPRGFQVSKHLRSARALNSLVQEIQPDIVNVHFSAAMFTTAIGKTKQWPFTAAMIHGMAFPILRGWKKTTIGMAERWAARKMDHTILLNESDRAALSKHISPSKISVIESHGLGCDISRFSQENISKESKIRFKRRLGIWEDDFVFIFVGRQVDFKGFDKLIRAFFTLYEDNKTLKLLLVGAKDNLHPTNLSLEEDLKMRHCPGIVQIGWKENVQDYLCAAHVNVFPSEREGMPVNLMESLALGIPVITTDSRGCNEVVTHMKDGLILESNDVPHIVSAMQELSQNSPLLTKLSNNALLKRPRLDRKHFIEAMINFFEKTKVNPT